VYQAKNTRVHSVRQKIPFNFINYFFQKTVDLFARIVLYSQNSKHKFMLLIQNENSDEIDPS